MRCLALCERLKSRGAQVHFICRELPYHIAESIGREGHDLHSLRRLDVKQKGVGGAPAPSGDIDILTDAMESLEILQSLEGVDTLIVDHYGLNTAWEQHLRPATGKILVVDDLANRPHHCDLLLDQNLVHEPERRYSGLVPDDCRVLVGPRYALLRREFQASRVKLRPRDGRIRRLLLFFGGADSESMTEKALDSVNQLGRSDIHTDVIVGALNPRAKEIRVRCGRVPGAQFHQAVTNMAELMAHADLALGAGGTATWERASQGLPAIILTAAMNQLAPARAMAAAGAALCFSAAETTVEELTDAVRVLNAQPELLQRMSNVNLELVDGRGAERVARQLVPPSISLRGATAQDRDRLFEWRNSEHVRRYSKSKDLISRPEHERWFESALADPKRLLFIAEELGLPVGVLRYDIKDSMANVSVYLAPGLSGRGLGPEILRAGSRWLHENRPTIRELVADIDPGNFASQRAFADAGYGVDRFTYRKWLRS